MKLCMNGGGPISSETQRFISMTLCPMIGGYGLTETCGMGALMDPRGWTPDALGIMPSSVEVKLVDFPDAGYYSTNKPAQGEVWIRGTPVLKEYYNNEQETKENISEDGWFKTGDIGEFDANGQLRLIDRKKNLVKTLTGEYIALEKLEAIYRSAKVVANICVYASPSHNRPIAIVQPQPANLKKTAESVGVKDEEFEALIKNKKVNSAVLKEVQAAGKQSGLSSIELVSAVVLVEEEWGVDNGLLTTTQKIQRRAVNKRYEKEIEEAFKS